MITKKCGENFPDAKQEGKGNQMHLYLLNSPAGVSVCHSSKKSMHSRFHTHEHTPGSYNG